MKRKFLFLLFYFLPQEKKTTKKVGAAVPQLRLMPYIYALGGDNVRFFFGGGGFRVPHSNQGEGEREREWERDCLHCEAHPAGCRSQVFVNVLFILCVDTNLGCFCFYCHESQQQKTKKWCGRRDELKRPPRHKRHFDQAASEPEGSTFISSVLTYFFFFTPDAVNADCYQSHV